MLVCCALQMPADVSSGGLQLSRGLGNRSGDGGLKGWDGGVSPARHLPDSPGEACSPLTSASCGCEEMMPDHQARKRRAGWTGVFLILPSLAGLCNMAMHRISAYLTLQLSPLSKVSDDKQEAKCKAIKTIGLPLFHKVVWMYSCVGRKIKERNRHCFSPLLNTVRCPWPVCFHLRQKSFKYGHRYINVSN